MGVTEVVALDTATERGPLMLRPSRRLMPGWDMVESMATVVLALVMVVMEVTVLAMVMERGLLRLSPRPMPGTDMVVSMATDSQPTVVMGMLDTAMERGLLTLSLRLIPGTDMM